MVIEIQKHNNVIIVALMK